MVDDEDSAGSDHTGDVLKGQLLVTLVSCGSFNKPDFIVLEVLLSDKTVRRILQNMKPVGPTELPLKSGKWANELPRQMTASKPSPGFGISSGSVSQLASSITEETTSP